MPVIGQAEIMINLKDESFHQEYIQKKIFDNDLFFKDVDNKKDVMIRSTLQFLYAYMPLNDITDYSNQFYRSEQLHNSKFT